MNRGLLPASLLRGTDSGVETG